VLLLSGFGDDCMKKLVMFGAVVGALTLSCGSAKCYGEDDYSDASQLFDHIFFGVGIGGFVDHGAFKKGEAGASTNFCNPIGVLYFGSGRVMNAAPVYIGGEIVLDLTKAKSESRKVDDKDVKFRHNGLIPSLGFRFGYVPQHGNGSVMYFIKIAASHLSSKTEYATGTPERLESLRISKLAPTVVLGMEKGICAKYSCRAEIGYMLKVKSSNSECKIERHGFLGQVGFTYNVSF
jgi:hypothetical protein